MINKLIIATAASLLCAGCVSMYGDPAERQFRNKSVSSYSLCEKLTMATLAPSTIREEWAKELESRGEDCNRHAATIQNVIARQNQADRDDTKKRNYQLMPLMPRSVQTNCNQIGSFVNCTSQ